MEKKTERIVLGSGHLYVAEFTGELPDLITIEKAENRLGYIQGGAALDYKPSFYEAKDDFGKITKVIMTDEEATMKSGVLTWDGNTLTKICDTARVDETSKPGYRIVRIGGVGNQKGKKYIILFVHEDKTDGDIRVMIVGNNQAGFSFAFLKDKETVVDVEFKAQPMDEEGTLIYYEEELPTAQPPEKQPAETQPPIPSPQG